MQPFRKHTGIVAPLDRVNVDTDQIIPKQFLKRIERSGYGEFLFYDWRYRQPGEPNPEFELNAARFAGASILVAGRNFGCGSSREHAAWALAEYGFRTIVAPSFADIFFSNWIKNGRLPVRLSEEQVAELMRRARETEGYRLTVDLEQRTVGDGQGFEARFELDDFARQNLLEGVDEIGRTLKVEAEIAAYEARKN